VEPTVKLCTLTKQRFKESIVLFNTFFLGWYSTMQLNVVTHLSRLPFHHEYHGFFESIFGWIIILCGYLVK
jgi:hypothetical protein